MRNLCFLAAGYRIMVTIGCFLQTFRFLQNVLCMLEVTCFNTRYVMAILMSINFFPPCNGRWLRSVNVLLFPKDVVTGSMKIAVFGSY